MNLKYQKEKALQTSVNPEQHDVNVEHNESLKEFLKSFVQNKNLNNNKIRKKIKTHAQVVGVDKDIEINDNIEKGGKEARRIKKYEKQNKWKRQQRE